MSVSVRLVQVKVICSSPAAPKRQHTSKISLRGYVFLRAVAMYGVQYVPPACLITRRAGINSWNETAFICCIQKRKNNM